MKKYILILALCMFSSCAFGKTVNKKTQIAGAIVETKLETEIEATGVKADKIETSAEVSAQGADLSKKISVGGNQAITSSNDSKMIMYIFGTFAAMMAGLITKMFKQLADKDKIILDLGNDIKEMLPKIMTGLRDAYEYKMK